jgi:hypothetical protein
MAQQQYTVVKPQAVAHRAALFKEADLLWNGEASNGSILSITAMDVFGAACLYKGKDALGMELSVAQRRMAERLGLFGSSADGTALDICNMNLLGSLQLADVCA